MKKYWVYDLETLPYLFTATFLDRDSDDVRQFVVSKNKDERKELLKFLKEEVLGLIGYNCIRFDAQILEYIYRHLDFTPEDIRRYAAIITSDDQLPEVPEWKLRIPHLDLYLINHFDNKNRRVSLKWCEFAMDLPNIEDLPSQGEGNNWEEMVLSYNLNDCVATKELYFKSKPLIEIRKNIQKLYGLSCINYSNSRLGAELVLDLYCKKTGKYKRDVRSLRTYRSTINIRDVIFPYIKFKSKELQSLLSFFSSKEISSLKGEIEHSVKYKGFTFDYGSGGIHGSVKNKVIKCDDYFCIIDADVASLYPSIAIVNKLYPEHLGIEFTEVYENDIVAVRLREKAKKEEGNKAIVEGFKEAANSCYGKSNDYTSFMYDPKYTATTTINGQLMLTMLAESLMEIENLTLIQINTDGATVKLPCDKIEQYYNICNEWMLITKLQLEYANYSAMYIQDVNNYISIYTNGKTKCKGLFEFENIPLHKNKSHNIIPIAIYEYFVKGKPIEDTIKNHRNIYDFCAGVRAKSSDVKGKSHFELHWIEGSELKKRKLSKTVRYFISKKGQYLFKCYPDGSQVHIEAPLNLGKMKKDWKVTYFNKYYPVVNFEDYDIDYSYYIHKAREIIHSLEGDIRQTTLF